MRERFWHGRLSVGLAAALGAVAIVSAIGGAQASGGDGRGDGHHPVKVCHWVPADGGSFVEITVDDNGLNGHEKHENDMIPADDECAGRDDTTRESTKTHAPKTKTVVVTGTSAPATNTAVATNTATAIATQTSTPVATQTGTVPGITGGPDLTPDATNTSEAAATATNTAEGGVGAATATPAATEGAGGGLATTPGAGGAVLGESIAPQGAGGAETLPASGTGSGADGSDPYQFGLIATAFAAAAGSLTLLLRRRMYR